MDTRNDITYLGIRREEWTRGKGGRAVELLSDLLLELEEVKPRDDSFRIKPVDWVSRVALGREGRISLNSDRLRQIVHKEEIRER